MKLGETFGYWLSVAWETTHTGSHMFRTSVSLCSNRDAASEVEEQETEEIIKGKGHRKGYFYLGFKYSTLATSPQGILNRTRLSEGKCQTKGWKRFAFQLKITLVDLVWAELRERSRNMEAARGVQGGSRQGRGESQW